MSALGNIIWFAACAALALWTLVALILGCSCIWFRRQSLNHTAAAVHRSYGEEFQPASRLRWAWIVLRSIPMVFALAAFGILAFFLSLPAAVWSFITGRPVIISRLPPSR